MTDITTLIAEIDKLFIPLVRSVVMCATDWQTIKAALADRDAKLKQYEQMVAELRALKPTVIYGHQLLAIELSDLNAILAKAKP